MEESGYSSVLHSSLPEPLMNKFKKMHVEESQKLHHLEHLTKELKKYHHSSKKSDLFLGEFEKEIESLKNLLKQHFDEREEIFLPKLKEYLKEEDLLAIQLKSIQKLKENEENSPLKLAFERNSIVLCEKMIEEILTLPEEKSKEILKEFTIPKEVKEELIKRNEKFSNIFQ
jgi:predicted  nucleic acid-binding Zn-ribbon protein